MGRLFNIVVVLSLKSETMLQPNDLLAIASVISAVGTLALAFFTYKTIKASKIQLEYLKAQTKVFTTQQEPLITIQDKKFKGNKLELQLRNCGGGIAYEVAVETRFYITKQVLDEESKRLLWTTPFDKMDKIQLKAYDRLIAEQSIKIKKEVLALEEDDYTENPYLMSLPWYTKNKMKKADFDIVYPSAATTFLFSQTTKQTILEPKEVSELFEAEPFFLISLSKYPHCRVFAPLKANTFDELITFLKDDKIVTFGITFDLVSRDRVGRVIHHEEIDTCIVDLRQDKTIEDAMKSGRKVYFTTLGWREIQKKVKWLPSDDYNTLKFEKD
jgi:hypothetical protein